MARITHTQTAIQRPDPILNMIAHAAQHHTAGSTVGRDGSAAGPPGGVP